MEYSARTSGSLGGSLKPLNRRFTKVFDSIIDGDDPKQYCSILRW